jgi:Retrotransposon gag protein
MASPMRLGSWIFSLRACLDATNADPSRWVALGSTCLAESSAVWYEHRVLDMHAAGIQDSWEAICRDLINTFQPISAHAMARDKSRKLRQTDTVQQFNCESLKTITLVRDMPENEKVASTLYGLKPHLKREVLMENCTTLSDAMQVASKSKMVFNRTHCEVPNAGHTTAGLTTLTMIIINTQHTEDTKIPRCRWKSTTCPVHTTTIYTIDLHMQPAYPHTHCLTYASSGLHTVNHCE